MNTNTYPKQFCDLSTLWEKLQSNKNMAGVTCLQNIYSKEETFLDAILLTVISECYIYKALQHCMPWSQNNDMKRTIN